MIKLCLPLGLTRRVAHWRTGRLEAGRAGSQQQKSGRRSSQIWRANCWPAKLNGCAWGRSMEWSALAEWPPQPQPKQPLLPQNRRLSGKERRGEERRGEERRAKQEAEGPILWPIN